MSAGGFFGETPPGTSLGAALGVSSAIGWALGTVYFKRAQERVSTLWAVAIPFFSGGLVMTALGLFVESPADVRWTGSFIASLLYVSVVGTSLAWLLWLGLVRAGEASRVSAYVFFVPLVAILIGSLFLGEPLSPSLLVGTALVVSGIYLVNKQSAK